MIRDVVVVAQLVLQVACFREVEVAFLDSFLVSLEDIGCKLLDLGFVEIFPIFKRIACFRNKGGVRVAGVGVRAV